MFEELNTFLDSKIDDGSTNLVPVSDNSVDNGNMGVFYDNLKVVGINTDELKHLLETKENTLALSCAGSGKTTGILIKLLHDFADGSAIESTVLPNGNVVKQPARILVSTFLKSGADELEKSFKAWAQKLGIVGMDCSRVKFKTLHGEFYSVLKDLGVNINIAENTSSYIRTIMEKWHIRSISSNSRGGVTADEVNDVACIVTYARNRLDGNRYNHPLMEEYNITPQLLDEILKEFKIFKEIDGVLDFEDLQDLLYNALQTNPNIVNFIKNRYDYIYVDEFQDTAQIQYAILKYYFDGAKRFICIGDDDQTIYSWRGSDVHIIGEQLIKDYNPKVCMLTTNYRCKENILNAVVPSITKNKGRHDKPLRAYNKGGEVIVRNSIRPKEIIKAIKDDLGSQKTIGVISRNNYNLLVPAIIMELDGNINYSLSKGISMNNMLVRSVFGIMGLVLHRYDENFEDYLSLFTDKYHRYEAKAICDVIRCNNGTNLYKFTKEELRASVSQLAPFIIGLQEARKESEVCAYEFILDQLSSIYSRDTAYCRRGRELISLVRGIIEDGDYTSDGKLSKLDMLLNSVVPDKMKYRKGKEHAEVKCTTVHEAKGKEWDSVYVWDDSEKVFPTSLNRELTEEEFEEERRVHYIAWTRAKDKLTVLYSSKPSIFLKECDSSYFSEGEDTVNRNATVVFEGSRGNQTNYTFDDREGVVRLFISRVLTGELGRQPLMEVDTLLHYYSLDDLIDVIIDRVECDNEDYYNDKAFLGVIEELSNIQV